MRRQRRQIRFFAPSLKNKNSTQAFREPLNSLPTRPEPKTTVTSKSKSTKQTSRQPHFQPRLKGAFRSSNCCWFLGSSQALSHQFWPKLFHEYAVRHSCSFSSAFSMVSQLQAPDSQAVTTGVSLPLVNDVVNYVNHCKSRVQNNQDNTDPVWSLQVHQDPHEYLSYFFNFFDDNADTLSSAFGTATETLRKHQVPPHSALSNLEQLQISKMRSFVQQSFQTQFCSTTMCPVTQKLLVRQQPPAFITLLEFPPNEGAVTLQRLFDWFLRTEAVEMLYCDHCSGEKLLSGVWKERHHQACKQMCVVTCGERLVVTLKRFSFDPVTLRRSRKQHRGFVLPQHTSGFEDK